MWMLRRELILVVTLGTLLACSGPQGDGDTGAVDAIADVVASGELKTSDSGEKAEAVDSPCVPDCAGKVCGDDGCGGSCGSPPPGVACIDGQICCSPDCYDKECGPDGMGGYCGNGNWQTEGCPDGLVCVDWTCGEPCDPDCADKQCGDDGCGGSCGGECDDGDPCTEDSCSDGGVCLSAPIWKPVVVWLLDTSTSMQYSTVAEQEGMMPACTEDRVDDFAYERSRWVVVLEALTGTFSDYWCSYDDRLGDAEAEDYNAQPHHAAPHGIIVDGSQQAADGIFDLYAQEYKFGLMAFDPKLGTGLDSAGGYSYGPDKSAGFTSNLGIHNELASWGAHVAPALQEDGESLLAVAESIQQQLLPARPYSGSPLAPALDDALVFAQTDPGLSPPDQEAGTGDPAYSCRKRAIIVITDGQPNLGEGSNGYPTSPSAASNLMAAGWSVHVVGFDLPPGSAPVLDQIAVAGGTGATVTVAASDDLRAALVSILDAIVWQ